MHDQRQNVLAVASGGGHWLQLMRLRPALEEHDVTYVTTIRGLGEQFDALPCRLVRDASRNEPFRLAWMVVQLAVTVVQTRPRIVISTGAAPGLVALFLGKIVGARTIWLDSIANSEELSMSGKLAGRFVDLWLTQWPAVATQDGPEFKGAVI
jgi:exopolysaccharide biosynthesis glucuronosyltransferase PssD